MPLAPTSTLMLGDCLERMKEVPDASVDMVLTDLPYATTQNVWDVLIPMTDLWTAWKRICRPGAPIVLFTQQPFTTTVAASNLKQLRTEWIWEKPNGTGHLNSKIYPMKNHENILIFCDCTPPYNAQKDYGFSTYRGKVGDNTSTNYGAQRCRESVNTDGSRLPKTVLHFGRDAQKFHPTQKPIPLCEFLIRTYSNEGDTVLDCCMGSGTTGVAAISTGRSFVGIERDENYFNIARERIADAQPLHSGEYPNAA